MKLFLKHGRDDSIKRRHPWIFSGAIRYMDSVANEGDVVAVYSSDDQFLCKGHYEQGSIAVRILTFVDEEIDDRFFRSRIAEAYSLRKRTIVRDFDGNTDKVFRLIHGEGDLLSGLVVDIYGDMAVVQAHSVGMGRVCKLIADIVIEVCDGVRYVYNKSMMTMPKGRYSLADGWLSESRPLPTTVCEYGNRFEINPEEGQKTGFYIDQRENRLLLQRYSQGATVLNLFAYTGAFSVYALRGGATKVNSVDSSAKAIELANRNVELNFGTTTAHHATVADVFDYLRDDEETYDIVVVDPPAFAKHHGVAKNALQAYKRLNAKAMERIAPTGGLLFTFSCSQAVDKRQFLETVFSAAIIVGRQASILHALNQPADHPVNIYHPEGDYLKGFVIYVRMK
jgi:23S rRNA (cytosine1962-C5)-methyltransferase